MSQSWVIDKKGQRSGFDLCVDQKPKIYQKQTICDNIIMLQMKNALIQSMSVELNTYSTKSFAVLPWQQSNLM